jgi:hypothetical protein
MIKWFKFRSRSMWLERFDFKFVEPKLMRSSVRLEMDREDHRSATCRNQVFVNLRSGASFQRPTEAGRGHVINRSSHRLHTSISLILRGKTPCHWQKYLGQEDNNRLTLLWRRWMPGPQMELHGVHLDQGDIWQSIGHATSQYLVS